MNVIERMKSILQSFDKIAEVCDEVHVDFADPNPASYGLSSTGDSLIKEDILGNQTRQHTFMLFTTYSGINDYERLQNSGVLLELCQWLHNQTDAEVESAIGKGYITDIRAENGMLDRVPQENNMDAFQYYLQIVVTYTLET